LKEKLATSKSAFLYRLGIFITEVFHDFLAKQIWFREIVRFFEAFLSIRKCRGSGSWKRAKKKPLA